METRNTKMDQEKIFIYIKQMRKKNLILAMILCILGLIYFIFMGPTYRISKRIESPNGRYELVIYTEEDSFIDKLIPFPFVTGDLYFSPVYVKLLDSEGKVLTNTSQIWWHCDFRYGDIMVEWDNENNKVWLTKFHYIDLENYKPSCRW